MATTTATSTTASTTPTTMPAAMPALGPLPLCSPVVGTMDADRLLEAGETGGEDGELCTGELVLLSNRSMAVRLVLFACNLLVAPVWLVVGWS